MKPDPVCDNCEATKPDRVGLVVDRSICAETDYGFCSLACFVAFVRSRWIETAA